MKLKYLGTAAAEAVPAPFCRCRVCERAREKGGRNVRTRSQALLDGRLLIDFPADTYLHALREGLRLYDISSCIITHCHSDHLYPGDLWCLISYAGRRREKRAFHLYGTGAVLEMVRALPEYHDCFVPPAEAFIKMRPGTLLIVVDTNRPTLVESPQILESSSRVAVIDHHRRASNYIENAVFSFHEPYASSASELVTELLQYLIEPADLLREEAEALMAGIVLDTKHFTLRTGGRTFEAAAFLRRAGADTAEVQRLFQGDLDGMVSKYDIIRKAELYRPDVALAVVSKDGVDRVAAAQAADELLTLKGVKASFVVYPNGQDVLMSGRSLGEINVQVILEALGGGGNSATAGGKVENAGVLDVRDRLASAIDAYFEK